ncbi:inositol monophosphatase [Candidatus Uhrbacteria bacterium]|nr:inositol monophosphatase [Candidatus Uhrbacteria bacterium]
MQVSDKFIQNLARRAGSVLSSYFGRAHVVRTKKHPADVVTEADLAAEKLITSEIWKRFPKHGIVAEESGNHFNGRDYVWYIDPLDGTFSFSRGTPIFCVMIGLVHKNQPILSAIYDPMLERLYFAKRGKGAFLNGKRIRCSSRKTWEYSFGASSVNLRRPDTRAYLSRLVRYAGKHPFWMSGFGSIGITGGYVACGTRDWYATRRCQDWEAPSLALLLQESGCKVTNVQGKPWKLGDTSIVAANKYLHPQLLKLVRGK